MRFTQRYTKTHKDIFDANSFAFFSSYNYDRKHFKDGKHETFIRCLDFQGTEHFGNENRKNTVQVAVSGPRRRTEFFLFRAQYNNILIKIEFKSILEN